MKALQLKMTTTNHLNLIKFLVAMKGMIPDKVLLFLHQSLKMIKKKIMFQIMAFIIDLPAGGATPVQDADEIYSLRESRVPAIPFFDAEYDGQWKYCTAEHRSYTLPQFNISWGYASGDYCAYCIYGADDDLYSVLCDTDGNIIGDPVRGSLLGISNGYAAVRNTDNELLFIGPDGRVITDSEYASLPAGLWIVDDDLRDEWVIAGDFINYSITKDGRNIDGYLSIDSSKLIDSVKVPF